MTGSPASSLASDRTRRERGGGAARRGDREAGRNASARRGWRAEVAWLVLSTALACGAVAMLAQSDRAWLLFYDGDSVLPTLVAGSLQSGQAQDWIFSPVLFFPELAVYLAVGALGLGIHPTILIVAVVNLLLVSACLRLAVRIVLPDLSPPVQVAGSLLGFGTLAVFVCLDRTRSHNDLELASLVTTSTYYASTVVALLVTLALVAALADAEGRRVVVLAVVLGLLAAGAVLVNPLYALWSVAPVVAAAGTLVLAGREHLRRAAGIAASLIVGCAAGLLGRVPFSGLTGGTAQTYLHSTPWRAIRFYGGRVLQRLAGTSGWIAVALYAACLASVVALLLWSRRTGRPAALALSATVVATLVITPAWNLTGVNLAARYLQPILFATLPVAACVAALALARIDGVLARALPLTAGVTAVGVLAASGLAVASAARTAMVDDSVDCVVEWVDASGRAGAGTFWTIRPIKAYLVDPSRLVQVRTDFRPHAWLVNSSDYDVPVSFVVTTTGEKPSIPDALATGPSVTIDCGRYTITDYAPRTYTVTVSR